MPAFLFLVARILIYPFSMIAGAGFTLALNNFFEKRRAALRSKKPIKIDFEGFKSEAHNHEE
jgi:hypothetical protein